MGAYILKRILLMIPTLLGIMLMTFAVIQFVPGGPVEQVIAKMQGTDTDSTGRISGNTGNEAGGSAQAQAGVSDGTAFKYRGAQGLDPEFIKSLEQQFGFDKPAHERFLLMIGNYLTFDFGESYFRDRSVLSLIIEKLPVSISLGLWLTLIQYLVSIPLGIRKAVKDGSTFDVWTSGVIIVGYAIPSFIFAIMLIVLFAGGSYFSLFPLRGLTSDNFEELSWFGKIADYAWHLALAALRHGHRQLRHHDDADQEFVPRRNPQAICDDGPRQGPERIPGALWPCFPQCHAAGDRGLPRRLHRRLLRELAADRDDLLARRPGLSLLQGHTRPRLSHCLREPLHLHAVGPHRAADLGPDLYLDRSPDRFREAGRLSHGADFLSTSGAGSCSGRTSAATGPSGYSWCWV
jgi:ABC-type dipeptide/oligopeptide/nickel transport system permease component